jgi:hypothetical protein
MKSKKEILIEPRGDDKDEPLSCNDRTERKHAAAEWEVLSSPRGKGKTQRLLITHKKVQNSSHQ